MLTRDTLQSLATAQPGRLVVSVYARTDPRHPANTSSSPAWRIALRNGLSILAERLEAGNDRDDRLAFRTLRKRIEEELVDTDPAERARSVALFLDVDGGPSQRFSLQLPLRGDAVVGGPERYPARVAADALGHAHRRALRRLVEGRARSRRPDHWPRVEDSFARRAGASRVRGI